MKLRFAVIIAFLLCSLFTHYVLGQQAVVDGVFTEWTTANQVAADPTSDNKGAFDISRVSAIATGSILHLHFDIGRSINLQNGPEYEGTLKLFIGGGEKHLAVDFRARTVTDGTLIDGVEQHIGWDRVGFQCLPTIASDQYEMRFDLGLLGVVAGDTVSLQFGGSDELDRPAQIVMRDVNTHTHASAGWTRDTGSFRVVNQNTLNSGLIDPERGPKFKRLFAAVDADVYCFQEEWLEPEFQQGVGRNLGDVWIHWSNGCAIASRHRLVGLPMDLDRAAAGLVTTGSGESVVVISTHLKCCGFAGSDEDALRVQQAGQLVREIRRMRQGGFGELARNAPVVLIGDYNLVGSRRPLDVINDAGLTDMLCTADDGTAHTWRWLTPEDNFWPGRLDLVSTAGYRSVIGRIFDSGRLSRSELQWLGLAVEDSIASDHLMLVVDCKIPK